jgi:hypothetical protein
MLGLIGEWYVWINLFFPSDPQDDTELPLISSCFNFQLRERAILAL